uniref:Prostatic spermine-binding protein-like n=1 Tax=Syphacia muris TaxID=451379 RepID=A0A0N5AY17_9BILA
MDIDANDADDNDDEADVIFDDKVDDSDDRNDADDDDADSGINDDDSVISDTEGAILANVVTFLSFVIDSAVAHDSNDDGDDDSGDSDGDNDKGFFEEISELSDGIKTALIFQDILDIFLSIFPYFD